MAEVTIYHNSACSNSRKALQLIRDAGIEPRVVEYLQAPPERDTLLSLITAMDIPVRDLVRAKEAVHAELELADADDEALIDAMLAHPVLINRPIVITAFGTKLCRPPERVLDLLPQSQRSVFGEKDGEPAVNAAGNRLT